jgi:hypothetical protein
MLLHPASTGIQVSIRLPEFQCFAKQKAAEAALAAMVGGLS